MARKKGKLNVMKRSRNQQVFRLSYSFFSLNIKHFDCPKCSSFLKNRFILTFFQRFIWESYTVYILISLQFQNDEIQTRLSEASRQNIGNMEGSSPLHQACKRGDVGLAAQLIKDGASINIKDNAGYNPFMDAISNSK